MTILEKMIGQLGFIGPLNPGELILILLILLLLFGSRKLPELARGMGKAMNEFRRASTEIEEGIKGSTDSEEQLKKSASTETNPAANTSEATTEEAAEQPKSQSSQEASTRA